MDTRHVISALIGAFCLFAIFAAITTARHLSQRDGSVRALKTKQSRQAEYDRLAASPCWVRIGELSGARTIAIVVHSATKVAA
jgi:hypothetical protein